MMGGAVAKTGKTDLRQGLFHARCDFRVPTAELLRTKGDIFLHGGTKKLIVRILKHQPDLSADSFKILSSDRFTQNFYRAVSGQLPGRIPFKCSNSVDLPDPFGRARPTDSQGNAESTVAQCLCLSGNSPELGDFAALFISNAGRTWRRSCVRPVPSRASKAPDTRRVCQWNRRPRVNVRLARARRIRSDSSSNTKRYRCISAIVVMSRAGM